MLRLLRPDIEKKYWKEILGGTRLPVATIFENPEDSLTIEEIMQQFDVTREPVNAMLDFAAHSLETPARP